MINDPNPEREWNFGVFIVHMEGMREQLKGRDFEEHKNWVFNTHPGTIIQTVNEGGFNRVGEMLH